MKEPQILQTMLLMKRLRPRPNDERFNVKQLEESVLSYNDKIFNFTSMKLMMKG
jgi:hypothetical protein